MVPIVLGRRLCSDPGPQVVGSGGGFQVPMWPLGVGLGAVRKDENVVLGIVWKALVRKLGKRLLSPGEVALEFELRT